MSLGICVLSYNHPEITARAVSSILSKEQVPILIHNGSEESHVQRLKEQFPAVQHLILEENVGYSGGVNFALQKCFEKFPWVMFLSNDCELLNIPQIPREPAIVAPMIYRRKVGFVDSFGGGFNPRFGKLRHFRNQLEFNSAEKNGWIPYLPGSAFLLHRDVFARVGPMDSSLGTYWEDVDWSVRAKQLGFEIQTDENFKILHRVGKTCHKNALYSIYYFQRNRKKISWKYCPAPYKPVLFGKLTFDWLRLGSRLIKNNRSAHLRHLSRAIRD